jgi:hypothetical protein
MMTEPPWPKKGEDNGENESIDEVNPAMRKAFQDSLVNPVVTFDDFRMSAADALRSLADELEAGNPTALIGLGDLFRKLTEPFSKWPPIPDRKGSEWEAFKAHALVCDDGCEEFVPGIAVLCPEGQRLKDLWWNQ